MKPNERLKEARIARGWTQKELAKRVGTTPISITRWERGITYPSIAYHEKLCGVLGMPPAGLDLLPHEKGQSASRATENVQIQSSSYGFHQSNVITKQMPRLLKPLIGRQRDVDHLLQLLEHTNSRLFTIVGTAGVGKTHFALQVAYDLQSSFPDGIYSISLESLVDPNLVLPTVLHALDLIEERSKSMLETLCSFFQEKHMLLLLDNFEHLLPTASILPHILSRCSALRIMVTSRAGLNVDGEQQFPLPPLELPEFRYHDDLEMLAQSPAIALFIACARACQPHLYLTSQNSAAIVQICSYLEGLPIAIELAAAGMQLFSSQMLLTHIKQHPLQILTHEERNGPDRQRTLRKMIDWSYSLLTIRQQRLLRCLAIFSGGATLEALKALCIRLGDTDQDVLQELKVLVNHHLVLPPSEGSIDPLHFRIQQVIRMYGQERIEAEKEMENIVQVYIYYFLDLVKEIEPQLTSTMQLQGLDVLEQEQNNLRAVFAWLIERNEIEQALHFTAALWRFWLYRGSVSEGYQQIELVLLKCCNEIVPATAKAKVYYAAAILAYFQHQVVPMKEYLQTCLKLYQEAEDGHGYAIALNAMGYYELSQGHYEVVRRCYEESLPLLQETRDDWHLAEAYALVAREAQARGNYLQAAKVLEQSVILTRDVGDRRALIQGLGFLGEAILHLKEHEVALNIYKEITLVAIKLGGKSLIATSLEEVGEIAATLGQARWATILGGAVEALHEAYHALISHEDQKRIVQLKAQLCATIDEETFTRLWAQGRSMTPEQALMIPPHEILPEQDVDVTILPSSRISLHTSICSDGLTKREVEVLRLLVEGLTDKQIAARLFISHHTVKAHLNKIYPKIGVSSRSAATRYVLENKLI